MISAKVKGIKTIIQKGLGKMANPYLSCSWGKDSIVLLYFVRKFYPQIPIIHINSRYSFPEIYEFRDMILEEWNLNYFEIEQKIDYFELCEKIGLPHDRKENLQKQTVKSIKKDVFDDFAMKNFDGCFWGIRADESRARKNLIRFRGNCFHSRKGFWRCSPLAYVGNFDIWLIIDLYKIPYCSLYDKNAVLKREEIRNSGWISTDNANQGNILHLRRYYPELFDQLEKRFPEIRSYS